MTASDWILKEGGEYGYFKFKYRLARASLKSVKMIDMAAHGAEGTEHRARS